jgi:DNA-binding FrmR family transcriptional regulator
MTESDHSPVPSPEPGDHGTCGDPGYHEAKAGYSTRLKRIEGQVRGIQRMVDEDAYCIDVLTQISAVTKALQSVATGLADDHIHHCVHDAAASGDAAELDRKMDEVMAAVKRLMK